MDEARLRFFTDREEAPIVENAHVDFLTQDFISHNDIRQLARSIAGRIPKPDSESKIQQRAIIEAFSLFDIIVTHGLQRDAIHTSLPPTNQAQEFQLTLSGKDDSVIVSLAEIKTALERLRQALILELATVLDTDTYHVLTGVLRRRIFTTHDDHLIKFISAWHRGQMKEHFNAMKRLYDLPERSPYILYPVIAKSQQHDVEILRRMNIITVDAFMKQKPQPPLHDTARYFIDNVRGLHFLLQRGFVHSDNSLDNMGIDIDHDRGSLFDLDGLLGADHHTYGYPCKEPYRPPEMRAPDATILFSEQQMAYEVGYGLATISATYQEATVIFEIRKLVWDLTQEDPRERPSFAKTVQRLDAIIKQI